MATNNTSEDSREILKVLYVPEVFTETSVIAGTQSAITWPSSMTPEDYEDFKCWIELVLRKVKRVSVNADPPTFTNP